HQFHAWLKAEGIGEKAYRQAMRDLNRTAGIEHSHSLVWRITRPNDEWVVGYHSYAQAVKMLPEHEKDYPGEKLTIVVAPSSCCPSPRNNYRADPRPGNETHNREKSMKNELPNQTHPLIMPDHLRQLAVVYIRNSTDFQRNLAALARSYGWPDS